MRKRYNPWSATSKTDVPQNSAQEKPDDQMIEEDAAHFEERSFLFPKQLDDPAESPGEEPDSGKDVQEWLAREQEDSDMDEFDEGAAEGTADTGKETLRSDKARLLVES